MTRCTTTVEELSIYIDGELEFEEELFLRRHLDGCLSCQQAVRTLSVLKETVTRAAEIYPLPQTLRVTLHSRPRSARWPLLSWATPFFKGGVIAALLLIAFLAGAGLVRQRGAVQPDDMLARALVAHHRSTDTSMDELGISSEDPNAVATWFQTQLPFPVRVSVLTDAHLLGGRVRSVFGEPTALVLYEQDGTRLSLFTLPPRGGLGVRKATPSSNATRPRCSVVFGKYAFCLQESEDAVHAVVAEGVTKGEELAHRLLTAQIDE